MKLAINWLSMLVFTTLSWRLIHSLFIVLLPSPTSVPSIIYGMWATSHDFRSVMFSWVCRQGNRVVHLLAKHALGIVDFLV